mmetsp:Transcript_23582/g.33275  ORF Transcript_23582/g.33275 Transcript_23582/m.33275 type:complete len:684 (+) Transcript_23582:32-2083(+)
MAFVATIQRFGSQYFKCARNAASMGVVPLATRAANLQTYLHPWPRRAASYLMGNTKKTDQAVAKQAALPPFNLNRLGKLHRKNMPVVMLAVYDATAAALADNAGVDILLVGDSFGNVKLGYQSTVSVSMEEMLMACQAVRRGAPNAFVVGDMPFGSYLTEEDALRNSSLLLKAGCDAVKLEGGSRITSILVRLKSAGIAVMGHIGLTPQTHVACGGYGTQGKSVVAAKALITDALALQDCGVFAVVIEKVPSELSAIITDQLSIPTIGIGAGADTSGQVLVSDDLLGLAACVDQKPLSFVKEYSNLGAQMRDAFMVYAGEVRGRKFPGVQHSTKMPKKVLDFLRREYPKQNLVQECCQDSVEDSRLNFIMANVFCSAKGVSGPSGSQTQSNLVQIPVFEQIESYKAWRYGLPANSTVGFVPTMGKLHAGHLSLVEAAAKKCDHVVVSIFVNPSQFAAHEDLDSYPRDMEADLRKLQDSGHAGKIQVFAPSSSQMYPSGARALNMTTSVRADAMKGQSEDNARPHFFTGVATVCTMLFNITQPTSVFFGQKDAMQCAVIRGLVRDLHFPFDVHVEPTVREPDGLAMSSRNVYLTPAQRAEGPKLYQALLQVATESTSVATVKQRLSEQLLADGFAIDYVSVSDPFMQELQDLTTPPKGSILSVAVRMEDPDSGAVVRLLDNVIF